jgi:hypothetical protein
MLRALARAEHRQAHAACGLCGVDEQCRRQQVCASRRRKARPRSHE